MAVPAKILEPNESQENTRHILGISLEATHQWLDIEEAHYLWQALMEYSVDAIYVKDEKFLYRHVSRAFCDLLGITDRTSIIGKSAAEVWQSNPELVPGMEAADKEAMLKGRFVDEKPKPTRMPDGTQQYRITTKIRLSDKQRGITRLLAISRDVTLLMRHPEALTVS
jgi:PAS domain S-box-containing protein